MYNQLNKNFKLALVVISLQFFFIQNLFLYYFIWLLLLYFKNFFENKVFKLSLIGHTLISYLYIVYDYLSKDNITIFWDMQQFLFLLNCNTNTLLNLDGNLTQYEYKPINSSQSYECFDDVGFGPFSFLIQTNLNIEILTIVFAGAYILSILFFQFQNVQTKFYLYLVFILMSPSLIFMFTSLNPDIVILFYFISRLFSKNYMKEINIFDYLILSFFIQVKIFPIAVLFGIVTYQILKNKKAFNSIIFFIVNLFTLIYYFFSLTTITRAPAELSSLNRTFGIYSDFVILEKFVFLLFLYLLIIVLFIVFQNKYTFQKNDEWFKDRDETIDLIYLPLILVILSFANYGYKFSFILIYLISSKILFDKKKKILILIYVILTPLIYFFGFSFQVEPLNISFLILNKLIHVYFYSFFVVYYFKIFKSSYLEYRLK